jgi:hypothetical protein
MKYRQEWASNLEAIAMLFLILVHENETNLTFLNVLLILLFFY